MIQKTSQRQLHAAILGLGQPQAQQRAQPATSDGPKDWGKWVDGRHYSLEITQHPQRARMCGFGDKDRRPLAPAAVGKMIVRGEDNEVLDVDDLEIAFFVVSVDLWSGDGKEETNLVLHPSAADRYIPPIKPRRKLDPREDIARPGPYPRPSERSRPPSNHPRTESSNEEFALRSLDVTPTPGLTPLLSPHNGMPSPFSFTAADPFGSSMDPSRAWMYGAQGSDRTSSNYFTPPLPSIHAFGKLTESGLAGTSYQSHAALTIPETNGDFLGTPPLSLRSWNDSGLFGSQMPTTARWPPLEPMALPALPSLHTVDAWQEGVSGPPMQTEQHQEQQPSHRSQSPVQTQHTYLPFDQPYSKPWSDSSATRSRSHQPPRERERPPRQTYTRTLVGPLVANAQRLQDEHRKPGIFFLFQDLSVRTEGTFRLRMRLMNVGLPPAPNLTSKGVQEPNMLSPVLAEIFSEPFTVYSAKRFPGVPNTTALSIAFANQGQKLPLRNRNGPSKHRRRHDEISSDDEDR